MNGSNFPKIPQETFERNWTKVMSNMCIFDRTEKKDVDSLDITVNAIKQVQHCPKYL